MRIFCILVLIYIVSFSGYSNKNVYAILDTIKSKYLSINDYQADIKIMVDVDFINIPEKRAKVFFKQPDKIKYKTDGFILIPKKGINFDIDEILQYEYNALFVGSDTLGNITTSVVKIIPLITKIEIVLATLWIDENNKQVLQVEVNTKKAGSYKMRFFYSDKFDILPGKTEVTFELNRFNIPFEFLFDSEPDIFKDKNKNDKTTTGIVSIYYSNYIINNGLPDSIFD